MSNETKICDLTNDYVIRPEINQCVKCKNSIFQVATSEGKQHEKHWLPALKTDNVQYSNCSVYRDILCFCKILGRYMPTVVNFCESLNLDEFKPSRLEKIFPSLKKPIGNQKK